MSYLRGARRCRAGRPVRCSQPAAVRRRAPGRPVTGECWGRGGARLPANQALKATGPKTVVCKGGRRWDVACASTRR